MSWYHVNLDTNVPMEIADNPQNMGRQYLIQHSTLYEAIHQGIQAYLAEVKASPTSISAYLAEEKIIMTAPVVEKKIEIVAPPRMTEKKR
jgi:hypothetical protein